MNERIYSSRPRHRNTQRHISFKHNQSSSTALLNMYCNLWLVVDTDRNAISNRGVFRMRIAQKSRTHVITLMYMYCIYKYVGTDCARKKNETAKRLRVNVKHLHISRHVYLMSFLTSHEKIWKLIFCHRSQHILEYWQRINLLTIVVFQMMNMVVLQNNIHSHSFASRTQ